MGIQFLLIVIVVIRRLEGRDYERNAHIYKEVALWAICFFRLI